MSIVALALALVSSCGLIELSVGQFPVQFPNVPKPAQNYFVRGDPNPPPSSLHQSSNIKISFFAPTKPASFSDFIPVHDTCPKGFIRVGSRCVWINRSPLPWKNALNFCNQYGLRLLEVQSGSYYVDIIRALQLPQVQHEGYWIGASKRLGFWGWNTKSDSSPESFWGITFNNDRRSRGLLDDRKHCAFLDNKRWLFLNSDHCDSYKHFLCETITTPRPYFHRGEYFDVEDKPEEVKPSKPPCEKGWESFRKSCYRSMEETASYLEAKGICNSQNSTLVSLNDTAENDWVAGLPSNASVIWIGLQRNQTDEFLWDDGTKLSFTNWQKDEPNNLHNFEHCVHLETKLGHHWSDEFCGNYNRFVCKKKGLAWRVHAQ